MVGIIINVSKARPIDPYIKPSSDTLEEDDRFSDFLFSNTAH